MYFHTHEYIYLTYFNDEIIALDLRKDQYILLSEFSEVIYLALNNEFKRVQEKYVLADNGENCLPDDFDEAIHHLPPAYFFVFSDRTQTILTVRSPFQD